MKNDLIKNKIEEHLEGRIITEIIELDKSIYIYSKEFENQEFGGPPLYINKETGKSKRLFVGDIVNGHNDLHEYFNKKHM